MARSGKTRRGSLRLLSRALSPVSHLYRATRESVGLVGSSAGRIVKNTVGLPFGVGRTFAKHGSQALRNVFGKGTRRKQRGGKNCMMKGGNSNYKMMGGTHKMMGGNYKMMGGTHKMMGGSSPVMAKDLVYGKKYRLVKSNGSAAGDKLAARGHVFQQQSIARGGGNAVIFQEPGGGFIHYPCNEDTEFERA